MLDGLDGYGLLEGLIGVAELLGSIVEVPQQIVDAGQIDDGQMDNPCEPVVTRVLIEINAGEDANRGSNNQRNQHEEEGADQAGIEIEAGQL